MLPGIVSALAPVGARELLREIRAGLTIAAVTTLSVAALPFVTEATRRLAERCGVKEAERDDVIRTNLSVAYPLGQIGNFFVYFFLLFSAYYYKAPIEGAHLYLTAERLSRLTVSQPYFQSPLALFLPER